jgi:hypothetical protein
VKDGAALRWAHERQLTRTCGGSQLVKTRRRSIADIRRTLASGHSVLPSYLGSASPVTDDHNVFSLLSARTQLPFRLGSEGDEIEVEVEGATVDLCTRTVLWNVGDAVAVWRAGFARGTGPSRTASR